MTRLYEDAFKIYDRNYKKSADRWDLCKPIGLGYITASDLDVGLARGSETAIYDRLKEMHYDEQAILDSGLCCVQADGTVKDVIQNSLVFPQYDLREQLTGILAYDLSACAWTRVCAPGSDAFLGRGLDKRAEFLILCETPEQTIKLWANRIPNTVAASTPEVFDTAENAEFFQSFDGPIILFPKAKENSPWAQATASLLGKYGVTTMNACDYLTRRQLFAMENVDDEENVGDYLAIGSVFLWCDPELTRIEIPAGIRIISCEAFTECCYLEKIVIPNGVQKFNAKLFAAEDLKELHIPASVKEINPFILSRGAKCTVYTTKGSAAERFAKMTHQKLVIQVRLK